MRKRSTRVLLGSIALGALACTGSSGTTTQGSGGATGHGGDTGSGGMTGRGGATSGTGGSATGGTVSSGGMTGTGGVAAMGGGNGTGGDRAAGGATTTGGASAAGGTQASGGSKGAGGVTASGGATTTGGATGLGGAAGGTNGTGGSGAGGKGSGGSSTGGTGTGGAGSGGTTGTGGATSSPVVPTVTSSGRDSFAFGDVVFEVDPKVGARVATLSLSGANMIATISSTDTDNTTWGAVFWTSPQSAWDKNWPPPAALDSNPYTDTGGIPGNHLVLDSASYAALGVSVSKDFSADAGTSWITIVYTIKASKALQAAPWENCRVPRGGLAFFPAGSSLAKGPLTMTQSASMVWFDDASKSATSPSGAKAIADGSGGWAAYALNGNLFLRKFTNTPASAQAPGEGQDEIYPGAGFLELEVQGPYTSIPAGGSLSWTIAWRIVKIPTSVTVSAGSTTLADFAKQQAAL